MTQTGEHIRLIDSGAAAEILDVSHRSLMHLVRQKYIPHYELPGHEIKFDRAELLDWLQSRHQPVEGLP
jgi:excisionase family DNA binding protein